MKTILRYTLFALFGIGVATACSDDERETLAFDASKISQGDPFTDARDGTVYPTVRIGNQVWMAENLRYAPPAYSLDGAYTWDEATIDLSKIKPSDADIIAAINAVADDPQYDGWPLALPSGITIPQATMIKRYAMMVSESFPLSTLLSTYEQAFPAFYEVLQERISELAQDPAVRAAAAKTQHDKAEAANGGYTARYGYLYTYDGALKAVPDGWRLPTDEDWKTLERTLGLSEGEADRMEAWRGEGLSPLLNIGGAAGFNAPKGGCNAYLKENANLYINKEKGWYYWSSTKQALNDSTQLAIVRFSSNFNTKVWRGTSRLDNRYRPVLYSVRCIKND